MVFSSYLFLFYLLPLSLAVYYVAPIRRRNLILSAFSYLFYGWANPIFLFLLIGTTLVRRHARRQRIHHRSQHAAIALRESCSHDIGRQ